MPNRVLQTFDGRLACLLILFIDDIGKAGIMEIRQRRLVVDNFLGCIVGTVRRRSSIAQWILTYKSKINHKISTTSQRESL